MKMCVECNIEKPLKSFRKLSSGNIRSVCFSCTYNKKKIITDIPDISHCIVCKQDKASTEFHKHKKRHNGLYHTCKSCRKSQTRRYYLENREKVKQKSMSRYFKLREMGIKRKKKKRTSDKQVIRRLRNRLYYALKKKQWKKNTHFAEYIGCTREELIEHIESQFQPGMTWENMSKWHIDHILPLSKADTEQELYKRCHYTNLRPMWAKDNIAKRDDTIEEFRIRTFKYELIDFVKSLGFAHFTENNKYDVYIKEKKIAINLCSDLLSSELYKDNNFHKNMRIDATRNGIHLIQIFEHKWETRKDQVKSFLQSALGKNSTVIYARNCQLKEIDYKEAAPFLDKYHILGSRSFDKCFALYHQNELVCLATFGSHHRQTSKEIQLSRFITKTGVNVVGGLSRLTKQALQKYGSIITFIDLCWSTGDNWLKAGWSVIKEIPADYYYYSNDKSMNTHIISKQSRKKGVVNTPSNMTEHEHALLDNMYRIYDAGKLKMIIFSKK